MEQSTNNSNISSTSGHDNVYGAVFGFKAEGRTMTSLPLRERTSRRCGELAQFGDSCRNKKRILLVQQSQQDHSTTTTTCASGKACTEQQRLGPMEEAPESGMGGKSGSGCTPLCTCSPPTYQALAQMSISPYRHQRTTSLKKPRKLALDNMELDEMRPRTSSLPSRNSVRRPNLQYLSPPACGSSRDEQEFYTLRSFVTTSKGVLINRGDSLRSRSASSVLSSGSGSVTELTQLSLSSSQASLSQGSGANSGGPQSPTSSLPYRVLMLGSPGVGKSSLTEQFSTSEYLGTFGQSIDSYREKSISLLIDGEQSSVNVIDPMDDAEAVDDAVDGFVVLFAIDRRSTFSHATDLLYDLRKARALDRAVILVANKCDLVRSREVSTEEAKSVAATYDCKYIETSVVLNHNVDELLVGVVTQIRLLSASHSRRGRQPDDASCYSRSKQLLSKLFRKYPISQSCENLYVL